MLSKATQSLLKVGPWYLFPLVLQLLNRGVLKCFDTEELLIKNLILMNMRG